MGELKKTIPDKLIRLNSSIIIHGIRLQCLKERLESAILKKMTQGNFKVNEQDKYIYNELEKMQDEFYDLKKKVEMLFEDAEYRIFQRKEKLNRNDPMVSQ